MGKKLRKYENRGITLIALIVTIIVLLILAGVSIAMLTGENGILTRANDAKNKTEISVEMEIIQLSYINSKTTESEIYEIGKLLYDKTIKNGNLWDIIVVSNEDKIYGTGYNFISSGTEIENYGKTKFDWVINTQTGELTQLEKNEFIELSYDMNLGTKDNLIFNMDLAIIENEKEEDIKNNFENILGENVEFINFDWNEESGVNNKGFKLDGINDYIKIKFDEKDDKDKLSKNGFTFEFYGTLDSGNSYNTEGIFEYPFNGLFCYWNGNEEEQSGFRCGWHENSKIEWCAGLSTSAPSDYSSIASPWTINYPIKDYFNKGNDIYFAISLDCSDHYNKDGQEYYKQTFYINGEKIYEGGYNKISWESFINEYLEKLHYFCIGRASREKNGWWHYSKMNVYSLRLYSRGLNENEISENYKKSKAYYETIK